MTISKLESQTTFGATFPNEGIMSPMERGKLNGKFRFEPSFITALEMTHAIFAELAQQHPILLTPWVCMEYHDLNLGSDEGKTERSYKIWITFQVRKENYTVCANWTMKHTSENGWSSGEVMVHLPGAGTTRDYDCTRFNDSWTHREINTQVIH